MLEELEINARERKIPIMLHDGMKYLCEYIKNNNITRILEIGSAIGYSSINMVVVNG